MNDLLKALYDKFYEPPEMTETLSEIKSIHQQLIEQLLYQHNATPASHCS